MFKGSTRVWRMPSWLARHSNAKVEATPSFIFNGTYVNNPDEVYSFYTLINESNVVVDELGSLKQVTWVGKWVEFYSVPKDICNAYGRCGAYGYCDSNNGREFQCTCLPGYEPRSTGEWFLRDASGGCIKKRKELSMCGNGEGFVKVAYAKIPDTSKARARIGLSMHECKEECLRNCSCLAHTSEAEGGERANCFTWHENLMDVRKFTRRFPNGGLDLYVRVDAVELAQHMESRRLNGKMVAVVVTSVVLTSVLIISLVCWLVMKKRRRDMASCTPATPFTFADLLTYKALLAPESYLPIPHLGIFDPATGEHTFEVILMSPLAETMDVETLHLSLSDAVEDARQRGEYWLEKREKE